MRRLLELAREFTSEGLDELVVDNVKIKINQQAALGYASLKQVTAKLGEHKKQETDATPTQLPRHSVYHEDELWADGVDPARELLDGGDA